MGYAVILKSRADSISHKSMYREIYMHLFMSLSFDNNMEKEKKIRKCSMFNHMTRDIFQTTFGSILREQFLYSPLRC